MNAKIADCLAWCEAKYYEFTLQLLRVPGVKVDNNQFSGRHALESMTLEQRDQLFKRLRCRYALLVFVISFVLTLGPDNLIFTIVSAAIDLLLFQCVVFVAMQQVMILYGKDLDLKHNQEEGKKVVMDVVASGVMIGKYPVLQKMKMVGGTLSKQIVQRLGPQLVSKLSRGAVIILRRQSIKWLGILITKAHIDWAFSLLIPLICALISGVVSVIILVPMMNKLQRRTRAEFIATKG